MLTDVIEYASKDIRCSATPMIFEKGQIILTPFIHKVLKTTDNEYKRRMHFV